MTLGGLCIKISETCLSNGTDDNVNCNRLLVEILQRCSEYILLIFNLYYIFLMFIIFIYDFCIFIYLFYLFCFINI